MRRAFTLIELLVVIAIVAILAGLLFPVLSSSERASKKSQCLSNLRQIGIATQLYLNDSDGVHPQNRPASGQPDIDDASGSLDEPIYHPVFQPIEPYLSGGRSDSVLVCPEDDDPFGRRCFAIDPDAPDVTSFLQNAWFVFGLPESSVRTPSRLIQVAERRSKTTETAPPFCNDIYHPWYESSNPLAPNVDMREADGAIQADRHAKVANYLFADTHVKSLAWGATYTPPVLNLHRPEP